VTLGAPRMAPLHHGYLGDSYEADAIAEALAASGLLEGALRFDDPEVLAHETARRIAEGKVVGWFQGRMEWGPRALGARSIVAHPGFPSMKDILNARIKHREWFRPFAPSILEERAADYFEHDHPSPFMMLVYRTRPERREDLSAVDHVDHTGRLQTVSVVDAPHYYRLIKAFERLTGLPVILNTSFNENEPIVHAPEEAIACFARTRMDSLAIGPFLLDKP
jgi:carbamoyltransferase